VVSTPIKEAEKLKDFLKIVYTKQEWMDSLKSAIDDDEGITKLEEMRVAFFEKENWQNKAEQLLDMCF
jgi:hypothetical protein